MRNLFIASILCLFAFLPLSAKQLITMTDGTEVEAEIQTIGTSEITYKKASNPQGPTYAIKRSDVFFILYEDGTKEIITQTNYVSTSQTSTSFGIVTEATNNIIEEVPPTNYFPNISAFPKLSIGYQGTMSGYKDQYDLDWGGLYLTFDFNVLFPSSNNSAWSIGIGWAELSGDMRMLYSKGDKNYKDKLGQFTSQYLTIPYEYWYRSSEHFMFGFGARSEILISQKCEGEKIEDTFNSFREALLLDFNACFGNLNLGLGLNFNLTKAFKGEDLDWSPTIGIYANLGYYF